MKTINSQFIGAGKWIVPGLILYVLMVWVPALKAAPTNNVYQAMWASVDQHNPVPEWFQDAKFGIYFHWGIL
jgi:alpha-L-fucosidase